MGVGERFLDVLAREDNNEFASRGVSRLVVAIPLPQQPRGAVRKEGADLTAMYRAAGFREVEDIDRRGSLTGQFKQVTDEMIATAATRNKTFRWMCFERSDKAVAAPSVASGIPTTLVDRSPSR
jgi:hypothetical protein